MQLTSTAKGMFLFSLCELCSFALPSLLTIRSLLSRPQPGLKEAKSFELKKSRDLLRTKLQGFFRKKRKRKKMYHFKEIRRAGHKHLCTKQLKENAIQKEAFKTSTPPGRVLIRVQAWEETKKLLISCFQDGWMQSEHTSSKVWFTCTLDRCAGYVNQLCWDRKAFLSDSLFSHTSYHSITVSIIKFWFGGGLGSVAI